VINNWLKNNQRNQSPDAGKSGDKRRKEQKRKGKNKTENCPVLQIWKGKEAISKSTEQNKHG